MKQLLILIGGIAIGAGISSIYHKNKYEQMIQEEVESLREHMRNQQGTNGPKPEDKCKDGNEPTENISGEETSIEPLTNDEEEMREVRNIINYSKYSSSDEDALDSKYKKPFIVTPEDFASMPGYDTDTFYYHQDDIISNDNQEIVDDIELTFGMSIEDIRGQFGVYEDDAIYIRNERLKTDYEILREETNYLRRNGD